LSSAEQLEILICLEHILLLRVIHRLSIISLLALHSDLLDSVFVPLTVPPVRSVHLGLIEVFSPFFLDFSGSPLEFLRTDHSLLRDVSLVEVVIFFFLLIVEVLQILTTVSVVCLKGRLIPQVLLRIVTTRGVLGKYFVGDLRGTVVLRLQRLAGLHFRTQGLVNSVAVLWLCILLLIMKKVLRRGVREHI
jgi:hypothetical protein